MHSGADRKNRDESIPVREHALSVLSVGQQTLHKSGTADLTSSLFRGEVF